jgi:hypothetical protein
MGSQPGPEFDGWRLSESGGDRWGLDTSRTASEELLHIDTISSRMCSHRTASRTPHRRHSRWGDRTCKGYIRKSCTSPSPPLTCFNRLDKPPHPQKHRGWLASSRVSTRGCVAHLGNHHVSRRTAFTEPKLPWRPAAKHKPTLPGSVRALDFSLTEDPRPKHSYGWHYTLHALFAWQLLLDPRRIRQESEVT